MLRRSFVLGIAPEVLEEHHQLQLEEDDRVHRRPAAPCIEWSDKLPYEREVQTRLEAAVEVVLWYQFLQREIVG
jgi:hypothetical protein